VAGRGSPFHIPVFVVTHHAREPLVMQGGTTFTFITDGIESALEQARARRRQGRRARRWSGRGRQFLGAGLVDELRIDLVPVLLGAGERLFAGLADALGCRTGTLA
jgi:dihydrofolate reductase